MDSPDDYNAPERPGCPVMIANGLYQVNEKWPDVALRMLQDHLTDSTRTCCDEHGFSLVDEETGCTLAEMHADPLCECGHPKSEHHAGHAYGLETFHCDTYGCGCAEYSGGASFRIKAKPVKFAETAQGYLFGKGVA